MYWVIVLVRGNWGLFELVDRGGVVFKMFSLGCLFFGEMGFLDIYCKLSKVVMN